jgi:hypothetical protein
VGDLGLLPTGELVIDVQSGDYCQNLRWPIFNMQNDPRKNHILGKNLKTKLHDLRIITIHSFQAQSF